MSDCQDMTTVLARELTMGIKNEVEDLSAVFKKMARLKSLSHVVEQTYEEIQVIEPTKIEIVRPVASIETPSVIAHAQKELEEEIALFMQEQFLLMTSKNAKVDKVKKKVNVSENQLSLFDFMNNKTA